MENEYMISGYASPSDWEQPPQETVPESNTETVPEATPEVTPEVTPDAVPETTPDAVPEFVPEQVPTSVPESSPPPELTVQDVAAKFRNNREELLKAIGVDDFAIEALKYYEATGSLAEYAEAKSVDFKKLSDEEILRRGLREEYAHMELSDDDFDLLFENRVTNKFKTDPDLYSEREVRAGQLEMKVEADQLRRAFIEKQQKFVAPQREEQPQVDPVQEMQQLREQLRQHPTVAQFINGKKLVLGNGETSYNYEINDPNEVLNILTDSNTYAQHTSMRNAQGQLMTDGSGNPIPDYGKLLKAAAFIRNTEEYERMLINYGKSLGTKEIVDTVENPRTNQPTGTSGDEQTIWSALKNAKWTN